MSGLRSDVDAIRAFLATSLGDDIHLAAIRPDEAPPRGRWFGVDAAAAADWAFKRNDAGENVYWTVNRVRAGLHKKAGKADVLEARFAHVDVDPPKDGGAWDKAAALDRLTDGRCAPSFVIDSGGGLQGFWRLDEPSINLDVIETINVGIRDELGADPCHNIDRLMRLPGTVNWPDARKKARGRTPAMAALLIEDDGACHAPHALAAAYPPRSPLADAAPAAAVPAGLPALLTADDLRLGAYSYERDTIDKPMGVDRSVDVLACAGALLRAGFADAQIAGVLLNPANAVSAHCLDQAQPRRAAERAISKAHRTAERAERDRVEGEALAEGMGIGTAASAPKPTSLPMVWFHDIKPRLTGRWLIKKLLPSTGLALVYGHSGAGKSFLAIDWAMHVALGQAWHGKRVTQGQVIYVGAEGVSGICNRLTAFRQHYQIGDAERVPLALIPSSIDLQARNADTPALIEAIRQAAELSGYTPALIVLDTLSKTFGGGKENTDDMATYVANCDRVAQAFDCCVMPVHHRPKDAESTEPRGHGSLKAGVDTVILVEGGRVKKATVTKQKDGPDGESISFALHQVQLGYDEDGDEETSCVVLPADAAQPLFADPLAKAIAALSDGAKLVLRQLDEVTAEHGLEPPDEIPASEINRLFNSRIVATGTWREKAIQAAGTDRDMDRDSGKKAFNRALKTLQSRGIVRVWGDFSWRDRSGFRINRDEAGRPTGTEAGHRDMPGHTPLGVSRCPGSSGASEAIEKEAA